MSEYSTTTSYPKRITDVYPAAVELFDAMYWHERERLGMLPDPEVPVCPICARKLSTSSTPKTE